MFDLVPQSAINLVDTIFNAPLQWLSLIRQMLSNASVTAAKGINLNNYFGWFSYLPASFKLAINSILISVGLIVTLIVIRAAWNMYLKVKQSAKWW